MADGDMYPTEQAPEQREVDEPMTPEQIKDLIEDELDDAEGLADSAEKALQYFKCELPAPPKNLPGEPAWEDYVSPDVRNAVLATMAEVVPGFTNDQPAEFIPSGPQDEKQASEESRIVTHVIFSACRGYELIMRAIQDALLFSVGVLQVSWNESKFVRGERVTGLGMEQLMMLSQNGMLGGAEPQDDGTFSADVRKIETRSEPRIEWVPAAQLLVSADQLTANLDECRFIARVREVVASDLVAAGIPKEVIDALQAKDENDAEDKSTRLITINECYARVDVDGDGIAELRRVVLGGGADGRDELLDERPWDVQPFAIGVPYFSPDSWKGISLFDRLQGIQDANTTLQRQILETGWRNLQQRVGAVERMYNHNDLISSRRGGVVRIKEAGALVPLPDVQLSPQSMSLLGMLDKARREAGGGAIDTAPQAQEMGGDTAHGLERLMSAIEQINAMVAKNLAETLFTTLYLKVHNLMRKHWPGVIQARASGTWLSQTPQEWQTRNAVAVSVGLSMGDRQKQAQAVGSVIVQQKEAMQAGVDGVLIGLPQLHNSLIDFARLMGISAPEQYWIDPASEEAKAAAKAKQDAETQSAQTQQQMAAQAAAAQIEAMLKVEEIRAKSKQYDTDLGHVQSVNEDLLKLLEISAKYTLADVEDFKTFQEAMALKAKAEQSQAGPEGATGSKSGSGEGSGQGEEPQGY